MYGTEVPAYNTLVDVSTQVNADVLAADPVRAERLGRIDRVTAERHGAIRVGTAAELRQVAQVFAALGMEPVGFYDLRGTEATSLPIVSTAFRPITPDALAINPFRVFTSCLVTDDRRYFDADLQAELDAFLAQRTLFGADVLALAERAEADGGLPDADAAEFLRLATACFELSPEPVDRAWYARLSAISGVAADIGGVPTTHINHLTPRVLDIDDLYRRMEALGITMIDEIQGPPNWAGPDVLLRQTSFKALAEPRRFREPDGTVTDGALSVRFGEVEQRGIALTPAGRDRYDRLIVEIDRRSAGGTPAERDAIKVELWEANWPTEEEGLLANGEGYFEFTAAARRLRRRPTVHGLRAGRAGLAGGHPDRVRGLPAPLGCRHLRLKPRLPRQQGRRRGRLPTGCRLDRRGGRTHRARPHEAVRGAEPGLPGDGLRRAAHPDPGGDQMTCHTRRWPIAPPTCCGSSGSSPASSAGPARRCPATARSTAARCPRSAATPTMRWPRPSQLRQRRSRSGGSPPRPCADGW